MKPPCEIIVGKILPQVRALVAIELKENYRLPGKEIALLVGTTEAAVSQYIHGTRGVKDGFLEVFPEVSPFAKEAARELYENRDSGMELTVKLGDICSALRHNAEFVKMYSEGKEGATCGICFKGID
jgi:predicted transcriptional regulator